MEQLRDEAATHVAANPRDALEQACRLACTLEGLLASIAEAMTTELERVDVRIAGAIAGSLSDQLGVLRRSRAA